MDMDTNKSTINRIVGFEWDEPGTDLEDEMPTPVASSDRRPCDSSSGDSRSVRPGQRFRFRLSKGDVGRISDTIYDLTVRGIAGAAAVEGVRARVCAGFRSCSGRGGGIEQPPPLPTSATTPVVISVATEPFIPTMTPTHDDRRNDSSTGSVRQTDRAKVFVVEATEGSTSTSMCQGAQNIGPDLIREGPFNACEAEPGPGQSPLVLNSMPGCQFRMTSYDDRDNRDNLDHTFRMPRSDELTTSRPVGEMYIQTLNIVYVIFC